MYVWLLYWHCTHNTWYMYLTQITRSKVYEILEQNEIQVPRYAVLKRPIGRLVPYITCMSIYMYVYIQYADIHVYMYMYMCIYIYMLRTSFKTAGPFENYGFKAIWTVLKPLDLLLDGLKAIGAGKCVFNTVRLADFETLRSRPTVWSICAVHECTHAYSSRDVQTRCSHAKTKENPVNLMCSALHSGELQQFADVADKERRLNLARKLRTCSVAHGPTVLRFGQHASTPGLVTSEV